MRAFDMPLYPHRSSPAPAGVAFALLVSVAACGGGNDARRPSNLAADVAAQVATVVKVRWTTAMPSVGYVEYGPTPALGLRAPTETERTTSHSALLLGLTADTAYYYRAVTADALSRVASDIASIRTGSLPFGLPIVSTTGSGPSGYIVVPVVGAGVAVVVLNGQGDIVWYHTDDAQARLLPRAAVRRRQEPALQRGQDLRRAVARPSWCACRSTERRSTSIPYPLSGARLRRAPRRHAGRDRVRGSRLRRRSRARQQSSSRSRPTERSAPSGPLGLLRSRHDQGRRHPSRDGRSRTRSITTRSRTCTTSGCATSAASPRSTARRGACEWVLGLYGSTFTFAPGAAALPPPAPVRRARQPDPHHGQRRRARRRVARARVRARLRRQGGAAGLELHRRSQRLHVRTRRAVAPRRWRHVHQLVRRRGRWSASTPPARRSGS